MSTQQQDKNLAKLADHFLVAVHRKKNNEILNNIITRLAASPLYHSAVERSANISKAFKNIAHRKYVLKASTPSPLAAAGKLPEAEELIEKITPDVLRLASMIGLVLTSGEVSKLGLQDESGETSKSFSDQGYTGLARAYSTTPDKYQISFGL